MNELLGRYQREEVPVTCDRCGHMEWSSDCTISDDTHAADGLYVVCKACEALEQARYQDDARERTRYIVREAILGAVLGAVLAGGIIAVSWWMQH